MDHHKPLKHDVILQWNINGINKNQQELKKLLNEFNPMCIALNETRVNDPSSIINASFKNYSSYFIPTNNYKGNLILIRKDVPFTPLAINSPINALAIELNYNQLQFCICSIYLSPNISVTSHDLNNLTEQLSRGDIPFMLLGDFNARSEYWHDVLNNERGNTIVDLVLQFSLEILNNDSPTHFNLTHRSLTHIDLSLCSQSLSPDLYWHTYYDLCSSDHFPILIHFIHQSHMNGKHHWKLKNADWSNFCILTEKIGYESSASTSQNLQNFTQLTLSAAMKSIPFKKRSKPHTRAPWWNDDCKAAKRMKNNARRKFIKTRENIDFINFKRLKAKARQTYRQAQKDSWKQYVTKINSETSISKIWKRVNKLRGKYRGVHIPTLINNNQVVMEPSKVSNIIAETLSSSSKGLAATDPIFAAKKEEEERLTIDFTTISNFNYNSPFSLEEMKSALNNSSESSPGEDLISIPIIKHLHPNALKCLLDIYNNIWNSNFFPPEWRQAVVIPFLKPGKNLNDPSNYRPIALTSCICKLMERMVNTRLMWYLEKENFLSIDQYGFRKNGSCLDPLTMLDNDIGDAFSKKGFITAVFFDLEKAYDTAWRKNILKAMYNRHLRGNLPMFISNFLSPRNFKVDINGHLSDNFLQHEGVPQGSILSTTCFLLAIDDITKFLPRNVKRSLYVDDFAI